MNASVTSRIYSTEAKVISMPVYRIIKSLCNCFKNADADFELLDRQTVFIKTGNAKGIKLVFEHGACTVTVNCRAILCIDIGLDTTSDQLMRVLINHNIVRPPSTKGGVN